MAILPEELVEEILSKLPAKSLVRLNSVCKHWLSLTSDSNFATKHLNNLLSDQSNRHHKLVLRYNTRFNFQSCDVNAKANSTNFPLRAPVGLHLIGSINGLLCIGLDSRFTDRCCHIVLWNPLLRKHNKLPDSNSDSLLLHLDLHVGVGFGYDSSVNDYKVVKVMRDEDEAEMYRVEIYTLKMQTWKTIMLSNMPEGVNYDQLFKGICVNGVIYWIVYVSRLRVKSIMCFDLINEKLKFIKLPPDHSGIHRSIRLMDVMGVVGVLERSYNFPEVCLWTMREDNGRIYWSEKMVIMFGVPISFMKNGQVLLNCEDDCGKEDKLAVFYDWKKETGSNFFSYDQHWTAEVSYIETLVSPYGS